VLAVALASGAWLLLELATMLGNPHRRALHDFIAGSVVMRVRKQGSTDLKKHGGA
jgi:uncharacterized RDD family membrane protein YckC